LGGLGSLRRDAQLHSVFDLLLGEAAEELNLLCAWGPPLVASLEGGLEVGFDVDVKCLRLQLAVRRVIHSGNRLCRRQVMQILCELAELSARAFLLPDLLLSLQLLRVRVKYFAHICVLVLHVL
jgi:hypothetical protein